MPEISDIYEQIELAAEAAGYLGRLDEVSGERQWLADHCTGDEFNPRENFEDAMRLICVLGLLVDVDRAAGVVTVVVGADNQIAIAVMTERFCNGEQTAEQALMLAVTRAAAEIGWHKT
ncbi:hypothetical protein [Chromobacterium sp.]|uniref:hypothetical protein n=1 Tax=Chromobacterium sp. TaxID=306190 RepID=UPI0035B49BA2